MRAVLAVLLALGALTGDTTPSCWDVAWRCQTVNAYRADHAQPPFDQRATLQTSARAWAQHMADTGILAHSPAALGGAYSEVVGYSTDWTSVMVAWDQSPHHRAILLGDGAQVGIGRASDGDHVWFVVQIR